jgi:hypothetical protein
MSAEMEVALEVTQEQPQPPAWEGFVRNGDVEVSYEFRLVPLGELVVDYHEDVMNGGHGLKSKALAYQRKQDKIAKRIVADGLNPDLFGTLIVNHRSDGVYAICDGGTRYRALKRLDTPDETRVPCLVFEWDDNREIRNYVALNRERSGLTQVDMFVAEVKYGDEAANRIQERLIAETGHGVGYGKESWQCVHALKQADKGGRLMNVLIIMRQLGWLDQRGGRTQTTVGAIDRLMRLSNFDMDLALQKWQGQTPTGLYEAKAQKDIAGSSRGIARIVAMILGQLYNKRLGAARRLDLTALAPQVDDDDE